MTKTRPNHEKLISEYGYNAIVCTVERIAPGLYAETFVDISTRATHTAIIMDDEIINIE